MSNTHTLNDLNAGKYKGAKRLKISSGLTSFPPEILSLFETLEVLDLSNNPISTLPEDFSRLHKLKIAFFSDCNFTTFPVQLAKCRSLEMIAFKGNHMTKIPPNAFPRKLRWLILTNNAIPELPASIGQCHRLQKCMLAGNRLSSLPDEMSHCRKLGLLRLSSNHLQTLPEWLFNLPELSFLSFAGNPLLPSPKTAITTITWPTLEVQHLLGEGASGIISAGQWIPASPPNAQPISVAIKLFKGEVTSDGSPLDEMNACIAAGSHSNLIDPIAQIEGHPEKRGLVLELIPPTYGNLGQPPTLATCTRDSFKDEMVLPTRHVLSILLGIASASKHIHDQGIAHGDLYAHNILIDKSGHALLGDFGAATIYGTDFKHNDKLQKMEVFAFGHLLEDLLGLIERKVDEDVFDEKDGAVIEALNTLHYQCSNPIVSARPNFNTICEILEAL